MLYEREPICAHVRETEEEKWKILYEVIGKRKYSPSASLSERLMINEHIQQ